MSDECAEAFELWLEEVSEDAADSPLELARFAFRAGWNAKPTDYGEVGNDL